MRNILQWGYYALSLTAIIYVIMTNEAVMNMVIVSALVAIVTLSWLENRNKEEPFYKSLGTICLFFIVILFLPKRWLFKEVKKKRA